MLTLFLWASALFLLGTFGLMLVFGCADRLAGGDYLTRARAWLKHQVGLDGPGPCPLVLGLLGRVLDARAVLWASLALAATLTIFDHRWPVLALCFAAWRWDGWGRFGGKIDPRTPRELAGYFVRHLYALAFVPALAWLGCGWLVPAVGMVLFAAFATAMGGWLAFAADRMRVDVNAYVEFGRGMGLGAAVAVILIAS